MFSYAAGRIPWRNEAGAKQNYSDGKIEVVGFHTLDFMFLQMGRPGDRICQASKVRLRTRQQIPMQIGIRKYNLLKFLTIYIYIYILKMGNQSLWSQ